MMRRPTPPLVDEEFEAVDDGDVEEVVAGDEDAVEDVEVYAAGEFEEVEEPRVIGKPEPKIDVYREVAESHFYSLKRKWDFYKLMLDYKMWLLALKDAADYLKEDILKAEKTNPLLREALERELEEIERERRFYRAKMFLLAVKAWYTLDNMHGLDDLIEALDMLKRFKRPYRYILEPSGARDPTVVLAVLSRYNLLPLTKYLDMARTLSLRGAL